MKTFLESRDLIFNETNEDIVNEITDLKIVLSTFISSDDEMVVIHRLAEVSTLAPLPVLTSAMAFTKEWKSRPMIAEQRARFLSEIKKRDPILGKYYEKEKE